MTTAEAIISSPSAACSRTIAADGSGVTLDDGTAVATAVRGAPGTAVTLGIRPEHLVADEGGCFVGAVELFERLGPLSFAHLGARGAAGTIVAQLPGDRRVTLGETLRFAAPPARVHVFGPHGAALTP